MSYAALASIYRSDKLVGIRLFDIDRCVCIDKPISEIVFALSRSTPIKVINLAVDNDTVKWTMGVVDRYASIDLNSGKLTNGDSAVAIGVTDGDIKKYKLVNYTGKVLIVDEDTAIKYARDYQIANCKLYDNGKPHLQAINGNIPEMATRGSIQFLNGGVIFNLPGDCSVTEFTLPSVINGIDISDCCSIQVKPLMAARAIKTLKICRGYNVVTREYISRFPNVEKVFIDGDVGIASEAFYGMKSLREVHINGCTFVAQKAFEGCCNLRIFDARGFNSGYYNEIYARAFYGCVNLDVQRVLDIGPFGVWPHAFSGARAKELVLPEEIVRLYDTTFAGIVGLSKITIMAANPNFNITVRNRDRKPAFIKNKRGVTLSLLELNLGFPCTLDVDANSDIEDSYIMADNITLIRHASMVDNKSIRILTKSQALGLKLEGKELSKTSDIVSVIGAFSEADICAELNKFRPEQFFTYSSKVIKLGDFRIPIRTIGQRMFENPDRIRTVNGFTVLAVKKGMHRYFAFIIPDKTLILESNRAECDRHPEARSLYPPIIVKPAAGRLMSIEKVGNAEYIAKFNSGDTIKLDAKAVIESA